MNSNYIYLIHQLENVDPDTIIYIERAPLRIDIGNNKKTFMAYAPIVNIYFNDTYLDENNKLRPEKAGIIYEELIEMIKTVDKFR